MRHVRCLLTYATVCMLAVMLHLAVMSCCQAAKTGLLVSGAEISQAQVGSGQPVDGADLQSFKPPKQSFVDYTDFLLTSSVLPPEAAAVPRLHSNDGSAPPPQVYLDIFIPPDQTA